jgi:hypothetical protein
MPRKKQPATQLTDHQLAHRVFGVRGHKALKDLLLRLDSKPKPKRQRRKSKP